MPKFYQKSLQSINYRLPCVYCEKVFFLKIILPTLQSSFKGKEGSDGAVCALAAAGRASHMASLSETQSLFSP